MYHPWPWQSGSPRQVVSGTTMGSRRDDLIHVSLLWPTESEPLESAQSLICHLGVPHHIDVLIVSNCT